MYTVWPLQSETWFCLQGPGGDADHNKKALEKSLKSAPPYQSCDVSKSDISKLTSNGVVQNGLEEDGIYR